MQRFLDQLPQVIATKADPQRRRPDDEERLQRIVARIVEATLHHRQASFLYHSVSSHRTKKYVVHPYRLAHAQGGLYVIAFVPEYGEVRTFAAERITDISLLEDTFEPPDELPDQAFPHSLGVHSGPPERISLMFSAEVAEYVRAREWHRSQQLEPQPDGRLRMTLDVCRDQALAAWILSFGPKAVVLAPRDLKLEIADAHRRAAAAYVRDESLPNGGEGRSGVHLGEGR
jgi:proteasome accessory factor B